MWPPVNFFFFFFGFYGLAFNGGCKFFHTERVEEIYHGPLKDKREAEEAPSLSSVAAC